MPRTLLALTALFCSFSPALAARSIRTTPVLAVDQLKAALPSSFQQDKPLPVDVTQAAYPREHSDEYRITSQTEVFLNGRQCSYADVPRNAGVVKMEVSSEDRTVLKIQFRTRK